METESVTYADVVVELPVPKELTYSVPEELTSSAAVGRAVMVPLRAGRVRGYIVSIYSDELRVGIKPISALIEDIPRLPAELLDTTREVARYYLYTWGDALKAAVPVPAGRAVIRYTITERGAAHLRTAQVMGLPEKALDALQREGELNAAQLQRRLKEKGMAALLKEMRRKRWVGAVTHQASTLAGRGVKGTHFPGTEGPFTDYIHPSHDASAEPKGEISTAWERISGMITSGGGRPLLLQADSLKAREEIYIRAAMAVTGAGGSVIILKPEIAAAAPFIEKLRGCFSGNLFITHSGLTEAARWDQWKRAARTEPAVVAGARSTVLTAVKKLRLIIVDEEEEDAYKQEEIPRYHARDVALMRGREARCPVILGSSTPSVESLYLAKAGEMEHLQLGNADAAVKPLIEVVDLKPVRSRGTISPLLQKRMMETLKEGGQVLLYLNRRGYSTFIQCRDCGFALRCHRCDISLTYHLKSGKARCRYCHHEESGLNTCPNCGGNKIWYLGMGTQKVEKQARRLFPDAPVCRLDSDAAGEGDGLPGLIEGIKRREYRIVVSTQMGLPYLRGHDFPLSALIWADAILNLPDFRAAEKAFRAIWQLAGREAYHKGDRRVVIQSFNPDHYSLSWASRLDYNGFVEEELRRREGSEYPPFSRMVSIRVEGGPGSGADSLASSIAGAARGEIPPDSQISVMGPTPVHLTRARSRLRWQILLKGREEGEVKKLAAWLMARYAHRERGKKSVHVSVDVDPVGFS